MSEPQSDPLEHTVSTRASVWRARLISTLPFVLTALAAVAISLFVQAALTVRQPPVPLPTTTSARAAPTTTSARVEPTEPIPTPPQPDERIISQEILDLQAELRQVWSAYYLMRATSQLADAEDALQINDLAEVEQALVTVRASLDQAYELSSEQNKGPIGEFRMQVSEMREELRIRPEGMNQRMRRLRQAMLSLVDARG